MTRAPEAVRRLFRVPHNRAGAFRAQTAIFPAYDAPSDALLVSDGRAAYSQFGDETGLLHISLSKGERTYGSYHIQNDNACISRLKEWLRRFKGRRDAASAELSWMETHDRA